MKKLLLHIILFLIISSLSLSGSDKKDSRDISIEEQWLNAVESGKDKLAISLAYKLVPSDLLPTEPTRKYLDILNYVGISKDFLTEPFNSLDFRLWYDALFLKEISDMGKKRFKGDDIESKTKLLALLFATVVHRIEPYEKQPAILPWPVGVWRRKFGVCDRQSWLLAELAYQAGFNTQIVYLINPDTEKSVHTICEIHIKKTDNGDVFVVTADPFSKVFLPGISVAELAKDRAKMKEIWPGRELWWKSLPHSKFWTPSYPQDYCEKNRLLYKKIKLKLEDKAPRFGEDPEARMLKYKAEMKEKDAFKMSLWDYPFELMKIENNATDKEEKSGR